MTDFQKIVPVDLSVFHDSRGALAFAEAQSVIPFPLKRLFWIYDVQPGQTRGGHAHKTCQQAILALNGRFDLYLTDLTESSCFTLDRPSQMVVVPAGVWCELKNFSADAVVLVATSEHFDPEDYLQPMEEYEAWMAERNV